MKTFVEIDDERFVRLCESVDNIEHETVAMNLWSFIAMLGIKPYKDGNQWCFLYGKNLQDGIAGFGDTIFDAAWELYKQMLAVEG